MQYLSQLLMGAGKRLALLWGVRHTCLVDWLATDLGKQIAQILHQGLVVAATWISARHGWCKKFPWRLAVIVDRRLEYSHRQRVASEVAFGCPKCKDPYMTRRIQEDIDGKPEELLTPVWLRFLLAWCYVVRLRFVMFVKARYKYNA